jgi:hypothetical protein
MLLSGRYLAPWGGSRIVVQRLQSEFGRIGLGARAETGSGIEHGSLSGHSSHAISRVACYVIGFISVWVDTSDIQYVSPSARRGECVSPGVLCPNAMTNPEKVRF